ncbi:MAG: hypothetical protein AB7T06_38950 [Kofleriaceae bacterium]
MAARDIVRRIPTYLACAVLCFAMFDVPSAYAFWRGWPWGVALAIGLLVFPVLPVAWHVWSERAAKKAEKPKPKKTTGIERFLFRTIVVAIVCVGGLIAVARGRVWTALKNDALWFLPTSVGALEADSKLFAQVPPSAQMVVWLRPTEDAKALVGKVAPGTSVVEIVGAGREVEKAVDAIVIERGEVLIPLIEKMQATILGFTSRNGIAVPERGSIVGDENGVKTWSTPGWKSEIGTGRAPVLELITRAPEDAFLVAVAKVDPKTTPAPTNTTATSKVADEVAAKGVTIVAWARAPRETLELDVTIEIADEALAIKALEELNREIEKAEKKEGNAMQCWRKHSDELFVRREGAVLHARLVIDVGGLKGLFNCADMAK